MIAALGTLAFLVTLWLLGALGATILEDSGGRVAAALKGHPELRGWSPSPPGRARPRAWQRPLMREYATWRDAA